MTNSYITIPNLKPGFIYKIRARNAQFGIWLPQRNSFLISRTKFGNNYLFEEYHWDTGSPHGTVKPLEEIEESPFKAENLNEGWDETAVKGSKYIGYPQAEKVLNYLNESAEKFSEKMIPLDTPLCECGSDKTKLIFHNCGPAGCYYICGICGKPVYIWETDKDPIKK